LIPNPHARYAGVGDSEGAAVADEDLRLDHQAVRHGIRMRLWLGVALFAAGAATRKLSIVLPDQGPPRLVFHGSLEEMLVRYALIAVGAVLGGGAIVRRVRRRSEGP
jgi:hypothetical protein